MKRTFIHLLRLSICLATFIGSVLLTACSNEHDGIVAENSNEHGLKFKLEFFDYDTLKAETRAGVRPTRDTLRHDTVSLGGLMADVCITQDTLLQKPASPAKTRALANGTYLVAAYQGNTLKGVLLGTVSGGTFTPAAGYNKSMTLDPGTYTFICVNGYVQTVGNTLTIARHVANAALIGKLENVNITAAPRDQTLTFQMRHVGALLRTVLRADAPIAQGQITGYLFAHNGPMTATFTMPSLAYSVATSGDHVTGTFSYLASVPNVGSNFAWQDGFTILLPGTIASNLSLVFSGGTLFYQNLAGHALRLNPSPNFATDWNKVYNVQVNLWPNFLYLMNDGSVALTRDVPAKQAAGLQPIGLVLSQSQRMAIALHDIPMGPYNVYTRRSDSFRTINANNYDYNFYINDLNGWNYTWDPNYFTGRPPGATVFYARADQDNYSTVGPLLDGSCWRAAGYYNPGVPLTGSLAVGKRSYLPTIGEWKYIISALHAGSIAGAPTEVALDGDLVNMAFTRFGGTVPSGDYLTSSEINASLMNSSWGVRMTPSGYSYILKLNVLQHTNVSGVKVRPFFKY